MSGLKRRCILLLRLTGCFLLIVPGTSYAADSVKGGELYATHCASCHGVFGVSDMPDAPNFDQGESLFQPDLVLLNSIKAGKNAMPAYRGIFSDRDILDMIAYLRTLN